MAFRPVTGEVFCGDRVREVDAVNVCQRAEPRQDVGEFTSQIFPTRGVAALSSSLL